MVEQNITIKERYKSRRRSNSRVERQYIIRGTSDDVIARNKLKKFAPSVIDLFTKREVEVEEAGTHFFIGYVGWTKKNAGTPVDPGQVQIRFSSKGGTQHITQSLKTVHKYALRQEDIDNDVPPPDFKGAIGVNGNSVDGVDIPVPTVNFTLRFIKQSFEMNTLYQRVLVMLVGAANKEPFMFFEAGEVTYLGADWTNESEGTYRVDLAFKATANRDDIVIGEAKDQNKKPIKMTKAGADYLWILYDEEEDANAGRIVNRPVAAYVERVCRLASFNQFEIPWEESK